jgi:hypothetical protein
MHRVWVCELSRNILVTNIHGILTSPPTRRLISLCICYTIRKNFSLSLQYFLPSQMFISRRDVQIGRKEEKFALSKKKENFRCFAVINCVLFAIKLRHQRPSVIKSFLTFSLNAGKHFLRLRKTRWKTLCVKIV